LLVEHEGVLYDCDGQHRRHGHIWAMRNVFAIVRIQSLQDARRNFITVNRLATTLSPKFTLNASRGKDPVADEILKLMDKYGLTSAQARLLVEGLLVRNGDAKNSEWLTFANGFKLPGDVIRAAHTVCRVWKDHPVWRKRMAMDGVRARTGVIRDEAYGTYTTSGMLRVLGGFARDFTCMTKLRKALRRIQRAKKHWSPEGDLVKTYSGGKDQHTRMVELLGTIVGRLAPTTPRPLHKSPAAKNRDDIRKLFKGDPYIKERKRHLAHQKKVAKAKADGLR